MTIELDEEEREVLNDVLQDDPFMFYKLVRFFCARHKQPIKGEPAFDYDPKQGRIVVPSEALHIVLE